MIEKFRAAYNVPKENELIETKNRSKGPMGGFDSWEHEEKDAAGNLIARYESWHSVAPNLKIESGFRKYSPTGDLLDEKKNLKL